MIVILEGPDGSGKTTLAKELQERFGLRYHHEGPPPANIPPLYHYARVLEDYRGSDVVIDRFALGERIYGPIIRGKDGLGPEGWKLIRRQIAAAGAIEVLCLPDYLTVRENWSKRSATELLKKTELFNQSYRAYSDFVLDDRNYFVYNYTDTTSHLTLMNMLEQIRQNVPPTLPAGYVGDPYARFLFVGERGSNPEAYVDLPFFATVGSSAFLNTALLAAGYLENEVAMVNAYSVTGTEPNKLLKFPKTIALGNVAALVCQAQGIEHTLIPHPQYWKRFRSQVPHEYIDKLRSERSR